ncbi:hypothetical protein AA957_12855 [Pseudomonas trivialis]|uniref:DUF1566 domain-containing protein n=1 Tax=Pseudomonas trivialis TaxID=200450 RepID=A0A0H5AK98_9PSED|nr:hypothetical protein AA957_12855 [Pseudomonas trivialis]
MRPNADVGDRTGSPAGAVPPAIGAYWPGQGGIYGGIREYPEGICYLVFAAEDVGRHAWSKTGLDLVTSRTDGRANTIALISHGSQSPVAEAAANYMADGHQDFYLPSIGELHHAWLYIPDSFGQELYWSSSQRSADCAYFMDFAVGWLSYYGKYIERLARPVRRILQ